MYVNSIRRQKPCSSPNEAFVAIFLRGGLNSKHKHQDMQVLSSSRSPCSDVVWLFFISAALSNSAKIPLKVRRQIGSAISCKTVTKFGKEEQVFNADTVFVSQRSRLYVQNPNWGMNLHAVSFRCTKRKITGIHTPMILRLT